MRHTALLLILTALPACTDLGTPTADQSGTAGEVVLGLAKSAIPASVRSIEYRLEREGSDPIVRRLSVEGDFDTLTTIITGISEGTWRLSVRAEDGAGVVMYEGSSEVYVVAGNRSRAVVYLNPVDGTGSIEVLVLWPGRPALDREFDIAFGQQVLVDSTDLTVTFTDVTEDTRCPYPLLCFWAGNARIVLTVNGSEIALNTTLEPRDTTVGRYAIALRLLRPYPVVDHPIPKQEYIARLFIREE